jgi:hypothetical protein
MVRFLFWIWWRLPGVQRRMRERRDKAMAGPYKITVVRHDLTREVIATGLTLQQATAAECDLITDETVLNFATELEEPRGAA